MMTKTQATSALRDALADLYPRRDDAERIAADAALKRTAIAFNDKAVNNWHNILSEADKHHKVAQLIAIALTEYPEYAPLQQARQAYLAATGQALTTGAAATTVQQLAARQATVAEQEARQELLAQHQRNLQLLRGKKAIYAVGEEPLSLLNQIEHEEQEIERIKAALEQ